MFHSILLPVDDSSLSFKPVQAVIDLARMSGAKLVVLSVAEPRLYRASDSDAITTGQMVERMHLESAQKNVEKACDIADQAGVVCEAKISMSPLACDEIIRTAESTDCDLIVMATRGKTGVLDALFNESTTQQVIKKSSIPVLVFP